MDDTREAYVTHLEGEINRLNRIIALLAAEIDISNEVFDVLSMEHDYDWISSNAKGADE